MSTLSVITKRPLMHRVMAKASRLNIPLRAALELTYRCNLRCTHCYIDLVERDELTFQEWQNVMEQLKAAGTFYLIFTGGEITVRADFLDIVTHARHSGFSIGLMTNCTLVTPAISRTIAGLRPFAIVTSLYGATAASHETVTQVPGSFQKTLEGIRQLINAGLAVMVQVIPMKTNVTELPQMEQLIKSLGATPRIGGGMVPSKTAADFPFRYEPGVEELINYGGHRGTQSPNEWAGRQLCEAGKSICSVSPRGDVFPCMLFPLKLGNLRQSNFDSIWRLEPRAELRYLRSMGRADLYACGECELGAYCQRCTGSAYLESGRMDGPSPSACQQARVRWRRTQSKEVRPCQKNPT